MVRTASSFLLRLRLNETAPKRKIRRNVCPAGFKNTLETIRYSSIFICHVYSFLLLSSFILFRINTYIVQYIVLNYFILFSLLEILVIVLKRVLAVYIFVIKYYKLINFNIKNIKYEILKYCHILEKHKLSGTSWY